jgi:hypothetical protein
MLASLWRIVHRRPTLTNAETIHALLGLDLRGYANFTGTWGRQGNKDSFALPLLFLFNALASPGLLRVLETPIGIILDPHRPKQRA